MNDFMQIFSLIFGVLGGSGALITFLLYRKQLKRFKNAEAFEKEVEALNKTVLILQQQVEWQGKQIESMQRTIGQKDAYIAQLTSDKHVLEIKHAKNKGAINQAYECTLCTDKSECPVLKKRAKNEEDYLRKIEKQNERRAE